jgi:pyridoxine 5-phosphate synthase
VPERREERTTEGGLNVAGLHNQIAPLVSRLNEVGARVSLFIEPDPVQIAVAEVLKAPVVELHTGRYAELWFEGGAEAAAPELERLKLAAADARRRGIEPHAGHGLTFENVGPIAAIPEVAELNIGHFLIGEAIFIGLDAAIREMRRRMDEARR